MRIALISDIHTKDNLELIRDYLKKKNLSWKLDLIIINGDILGENEVRQGYGYNYNKTLFLASIDKDRILQKLVPEKAAELKEIAVPGKISEIEAASLIKDYVLSRYGQLFNSLLSFSDIAKTYFNIGTYESPLHYNVLKELAFLLDLEEPYLKKIAMLSNYRDSFKVFLSKIKDPSLKKLKYIGGSAVLEGDLLIAGIPGLNASPVITDSASEFQEKVTADLLDTVRRKMGYASKLLILNQTQGRLRKDPFSFRPASLAVRKFIEDSKKKMRHKIFVQSYHHWVTTHFYTASEFNFMLNNAAVNNGIFNLIEIGNKVVCYDIDPKLDKARRLNTYNYNIADYSSPEERLSLNYEDSYEVINQRNLKGCYYI